MLVQYESMLCHSVSNEIYRKLIVNPYRFTVTEARTATAESLSGFLCRLTATYSGFRIVLPWLLRIRHDHRGVILDGSSDSQFFKEQAEEMPNLSQVEPMLRQSVSNAPNAKLWPSGHCFKGIRVCISICVPPHTDVDGFRRMPHHADVYPRVYPDNSIQTHRQAQAIKEISAHSEAYPIISFCMALSVSLQRPANRCTDTRMMN